MFEHFISSIEIFLLAMVDNQVTYAQFVLVLIFSRKCFIFQRAFPRKLFYFPVFGNDLENEFKNVFWCLVYNFF